MEISKNLIGNAGYRIWKIVRHNGQSIADDNQDATSFIS